MFNWLLMNFEADLRRRNRKRKKRAISGQLSRLIKKFINGNRRKGLIVGFLIVMINNRKMDLNSYDEKVWKVIVKFYRGSKNRLSLLYDV